MILEIAQLAEMVNMCKRGHSDFFQIKLVGRKTKFCDYILAYRQKEGIGGRALFCGDLPRNKPIPKGYLALESMIL